jgi:hypothetical protein
MDPSLAADSFGTSALAWLAVIGVAAALLASQLRAIRTHAEAEKSLVLVPARARRHHRQGACS